MTCGEFDYDQDAEQPRQQRDWDCSAAATAWMGRSLGWGWQELDVAFEFARAGLATPAVGLLDGTGAGIVRWLEQQPFPARNQRASWDIVNSFLGECPLIMGSSRYYHWIGVRSSDGYTLQLANSAPGWAGVWQTMDQATFDKFGDFWLVRPV